jgi:hypothetical protein
MDINTLSSIATAIGVLVAATQLWASRQQATTQFEDSLAQDYRAILRKIPIQALLGEDLSDEEYKNNLDNFYYYIDLTNEQVFLRKVKRLRRDTWLNWCDGIRSNLSRPTFHRAWEEIKERSDNNFQELRKLEKGNFKSDPASWK